MPPIDPAANTDPNAMADGQDPNAGGGDKLDKVLERLDSMATRLDAMDGGGKGSPMEPGAAQGDPDPKPPVGDAGAGGDGGEEFPPEIASMPRETAADKVRFDAACAGYKSMQASKADAMRKDSEKDAALRFDSASAGLRKEIAELKAMIRPVPEDQARELAAEQVRADAAYAAHGSQASRPVQGETLLAYRRRLAAGLQKHSPAWKGIDLATLPAAALDLAASTIYGDAAVAARNPVDVPEGTLREIVTTDTTGRRITTFAGEPRSWMAQFSANRRRVTGISNGSR